MSNYRVFPNRLLKLRKDHGLSQKKLAQEIGVSQASINYWEKGERTPSVDAVQKIAEYFNIQITDLLRDANTDPLTIGVINELREIVESDGGVADIPDLIYENSKTNLQYLIEYCESETCIISPNVRNKLKEAIQTSILEAKKSGTYAENSYSLAVEFSHKVLDALLMEYCDCDMTEVIELLDFYLSINQKGKDKLLSYASDLYSTGKYNKT